MRKTLSYGFKSLLFAWRANGISAVISLISKLYDNTLYPFIQIFLLAQVLDLFSRSQTITLNQLSGIIIFYIIASIIKLALRSFLDIKEAYLQVQLEGYIDLQITKKLTELDPATFEKPSFQNILAQLEGVKGTLQMHLVRFTGLIDALFKFITAAIVVSIIFPTFAPL